MTARRFFSVTGTIVVGAIAGIASYTHMRDVALATHQGRLIADLGPFSVDGLVLVATLAIGDGRKSTFTAWASFLIGVGASLAANIAAADGTTAGRVVSAWPSVGFLLAVEVFLAGARKRAADVITASTPTQTENVRVTATGAAVTSSAPVVVTSNDVPVAAPTAPKPASPRTRPAASRRPRGGGSSADRVAAAARKMPNATTAQIAAKANVSESTARRHLPSVVTSPGTTEAPVDDVTAVDVDEFGTATFVLPDAAAVTPINGHVFANVSS